MPPAAISGTLLTTLRTSGNRSRKRSMVPRCPPASTDSTTMASAPLLSARRANCGEETIEMMGTPASRPTLKTSREKPAPVAIMSTPASIEAGVDMIATGAGFSRDVFKVGREAGVPIISIVSSPQFARLAERSGADAIVVESVEAGGHLGTMERLRDLFPEVRKVVSKVPLIAAGGITEGREIAEMIFKYGADGVQMATRFVLTEECDVADSYKQAYLNAKAEDIVLMDSPVGLPGRAIRNRLIERLEAEETIRDRCPWVCLKRCSRSFCINDRLERARTGDVDEGLVFTGENVWRCEDIPPVADLMERLVREAEAAPVAEEAASSG